MSYIILEEMNKLKEDIKERKVKNEKLRAEIIRILGEADYHGLYNFFGDLLSKKELKYLVIMSRRCLVLCQIFIVFIILDEKENELNDELVVLSDKAIPFYGDSLTGKVGVVDDILIHGRTIRKIYSLLKTFNPMVEPVIYGYKKDIDLACMPDELVKVTNVFAEEYKSEWRNLSNKIVRCIYASNVPYTSFVTSFFQYDSNKIYDKIKEIATIEVIENGADGQDKEGLSSYYCYEKKEKNTYPLFNKLVLAKGIRLYWNGKIEKMTIIPYVFIRHINLYEVKELFDYMAQKIPAKYNTIVNILKKESEECEINNALIAYKMRLLTCLLSRIYWLDFLCKNNIEEAYSVDFDTIEKSFGYNVAKELLKIKKEELVDILNLDLNISKCYEKNEPQLDDFVEGGQRSIKEKPEECIKQYFHKAWYEDECRAKRDEERSQGISVDNFLKYFSKDVNETQKKLAILIHIWDTGIAAANFAVDKTESYVACFNTSGEQSYRVIIERNRFVFYALIAVSKLFRKGDVKKGKSFEQYRKKMLIKLLDKLNENSELEDYKSIKNIIEFESGYLNGWNQVEIIGDMEVDASINKQKELVMEFVDEYF